MATHNPYVRLLKKNIFQCMPFILLLSVLLTSCMHRQSVPHATDADTLNLRHAKYLTLVEHEDYTEVLIRNPWNDSKLLQRFVINKGDNVGLRHVDGASLSSSSNHLAVFTTTHANLFEELGGIDAVAGVCETEYIANPRLCEALSAGRIRDLGSAMTPDRERIISLAPDLILLSPYENASTYGNLESLGIPIVQCADYMETTALGRAEWMRLYGRLVGKAREADSLFLAVEAQYYALQSLTDSIASEARPSVLFDTKNGSAWYVPGGRSTMAQLIHDAGGRYLFVDNPKSGSVPLAFETVLDRGEQAHVWLIRYNNSRQRMTLPDLGSIYQPYTLFRAYRSGQVYGCNSAELTFYEETPFHPERLLRDYICILHPTLLPADTLRYFHQL